MIGMISVGWALALAQPSAPQVIESWKIEATEPLSGSDFLLILEAFKHPEIRGRDLSCYHIAVVRQKGVRTVAFSGDREHIREVGAGDTKSIILPGPNPLCPSRSFEMDDDGKVERVIYERH